MTGTECQGKSCCSNILVPGGMFAMGRCGDVYDAVSCTDGHAGYNEEVPEHSATVADYYLDEYEVTVGRFRKFVEQYDGTPPADGAGASGRSEQPTRQPPNSDHHRNQRRMG